MEKNILILIALGIAVFLEYMPKIGRIFKGFNTLVHESGHAFASLLFSGEVVSVDIFYSGEGVATTKSKSWLSKFIISLIGYPFASAYAFMCAYFIAGSNYSYILYSFASIALINLLFWVRNPYGIAWLLSTLTLIFLAFYFEWNQVKQYAALLITAFCFVDAYLSAWYILYLSIKQPKKAGDATNLQKVAWLPAIFWALIFWIQASLFALLSIHLFLPLPFLVPILNIL